MNKKRQYTSDSFNYEQDSTQINFRKHPELYQIGRGEQGVLMVEPYKSEILPFWRFKDEEIAKRSAEKIYQLFLDYKKKNDFVGMDMARKFLQMGYTRSRRYANHKNGQKYEHNPQNELTKTAEKKAREKILPQEVDALNNEKAKAAKVFYEYYLQVKIDVDYQKMKKNFKDRTQESN